MNRIKSLLYCFCLFGIVLTVCFGCAHNPVGENGVAPRYLKWNVHYQDHRRDAKASYANWTDPGQGHMVLPVNTQVKFGEFRGGFSIISLSAKSEILFDYDEKNMRLAIGQYQALLTSPTPISLNAFSERDRKGISEGKAYVGMTKTGVMTALGYPAAHRTPSPDANTWVYWKNRFKTFTVQFDDKGLVSDVGR